MRTHHDAKAMASALRHALRERHMELSHSDTLEIVARQFGFRNWNVLAAQLDERVPAPCRLQLPFGWRAISRPAHLYDVGIDPQVTHDGKAVAVVRSRAPEDGTSFPEDANAIFQQIVSAKQWLGRRIVFEGQLRSQDIIGSGNIWLRIDTKPGQVLVFDDLRHRQPEVVLKGSNPWTMRRIVVDVPPDADLIHFAVQLSGTGALWATSLKLEEIGVTVPTTNARQWRHEQPVNLDFAESASMQR